LPSRPTRAGVCWGWVKTVIYKREKSTEEKGGIFRQPANLSQVETACVSRLYALPPRIPAGISRWGLLSEVGVAKMKTSLILISQRSLRFDGGVDFGRDCRDDQGCHRQEGYRCFIDVIIHGSFHSNRNANISWGLVCPPAKARAIGAKLKTG